MQDSAPQDSTFQARLLERLQELERKVTSLQRSLQNRLGRLQGEVQELELLDFQGQIAALDAKLKTEMQAIDLRFIGSGRLLLAAYRYAAWLDVSTLTATFIAQLATVTLPAPTFTNAREYVLRAAEATYQQINSSDNPHAVANEFRGRLEAYCRRTGIQFFLEQ